MFELQLAEKSVQQYFQNLTPEPYHVEVYQWDLDNHLLVKIFLHHQYIGKLLIEDIEIDQTSLMIIIREFLYG